MTLHLTDGEKQALREVLRVASGNVQELELAKHLEAISQKLAGPGLPERCQGGGNVQDFCNACEARQLNLFGTSPITDAYREGGNLRDAAIAVFSAWTRREIHSSAEASASFTQLAQSITRFLETETARYLLPKSEVAELLATYQRDAIAHRQPSIQVVIDYTTHPDDPAAQQYPFMLDEADGTFKPMPAGNILNRSIIRIAKQDGKLVMFMHHTNRLAPITADLTALAAKNRPDGTAPAEALVPLGEVLNILHLHIKNR